MISWLLTAISGQVPELVVESPVAHLGSMVMFVSFVWGIYHFSLRAGGKAACWGAWLKIAWSRWLCPFAGHQSPMPFANPCQLCFSLLLPAGLVLVPAQAEAWQSRCTPCRHAGVPGISPCTSFPAARESFQTQTTPTSFPPEEPLWMPDRMKPGVFQVT